MCSDEGDFAKTRKILGELGVSDPTVKECEEVKYICTTPTTRSAYCTGAGQQTIERWQVSRLLGWGRSADYWAGAGQQTIGRWQVSRL